MANLFGKTSITSLVVQDDSVFCIECFITDQEGYSHETKIITESLQAQYTVPGEINVFKIGERLVKELGGVIVPMNGIKQMVETVWYVPISEVDELHRSIATDLIPGMHNENRNVRESGGSNRDGELFFKDGVAVNGKEEEVGSCIGAEESVFGARYGAVQGGVVSDQEASVVRAHLGIGATGEGGISDQESFIRARGGVEPTVHGGDSDQQSLTGTVDHIKPNQEGDVEGNAAQVEDGLDSRMWNFYRFVTRTPF